MRKHKLSAIFAEAANRIELGQNSFICETLDNMGISWPDRDRAKDVIWYRLGNSLYYTNWVRANHPELFHATPEHQRAAAARDGRIRWCRALAREFAAKGD